MSFNDNPRVDLSSERSEVSVLAVRSLFSQKNRFICREETPDFGVDLTVELITNGSASGRRFPIQIKSCKKSHRLLLDGEEHVSLEFSTSRLGYLCRAEPAYGLIVIYDDSTERAYYDFVEKIYERVSLRKESSKWQQQSTITIHIPTTNELNGSSVEEIHNTFRIRFDNHSLLIKRHGPGFNIPVIDKSDISTLDIDDARSVLEFLTTYGSTLINERELIILVRLIRKLSYESLESSARLSCIAAIGFSASGRLVEADYFIRKANRHRDELSPEESVLLDLYGAEIGFRFGRLDVDQYIDKLSRLRNSSSVVANQLGIAVTIDRLSILRTIGSHDVDYEDLQKQLEKTIEEVRKAKVGGRAEHVLLLKCAEHLHQLGINLQRTLLTSFRIQAAIIGPPPIGRRIEAAKRVIGVINRAIAIMESVDREIRNDEGMERTIKPHLQALLAWTFFSFSFNVFMLQRSLGEACPPKELYLLRFGNAIDAYNAFSEEGSLADAYSALNTALELKALYRELFSEALGSFDDTDLMQRMDAISEELGKPKWASCVIQFVEEALPAIRNADSRGFRDLEPGQEVDYAKTFADALGLPSSRIANIVADIRALREFATEYPEPNSQLLQDLRHTAKRETLYAEPVTYTGVCTQCQFSTLPSRRVSEIIASFHVEHGRVCPGST